MPEVESSHPPAMPRSRQILVLGMHRSGTSALARVLGLMGVWLGDEDELLPAHPTDNPTGYWERADVVSENDRFLERTGHNWDRVADFDCRASDPAARVEFQARAGAIVRQLDGIGSTWLLKDPRLCLLLPLWQPLLARPVHVFAVRDPRDIAASLTASHRGVYTAAFLLSLAEKYLRSALDALHGQSVIFVSYADLVADPIGQVRRLFQALLDAGVSGLKLPTDEAILAFLDPRLQRSQLDPDVWVSDEQSRLNAWLTAQTAAVGAVRVVDAPSGSADARLREGEAARAHDESVGRKLALGDIALRLDQLRDALAAENRHFREELKAQRDLAWQQRDEAVREREEALFLHTEALQREELREAQLEMTRIHAENLTTQLASLNGYAAQLAGTADALQSSLSWRLTAPLRWATRWISIKPNFRVEQFLYRAYYAVPGPSTASKRAFVLRLHRLFPWLTRHTLSHEINARTQELIRQRTSDPAERERLQRINADSAETLLSALEETPLISIVMPVYNVEARWLQAAVDSVRRQFYPNWELCIADDASTSKDTRKVLAGLADDGDERIKVVRLDANSGIAAASNAALAIATGSHVGFLDHDDELTRDALLEMVRVINRDNPDMIYSDEDKIDENGDHVEPFFKPDFSPDYLLSNNYICHFSVVCRDLLQQLEGFRPGFDGAQDFDLMLRVSEHTDRIAHIPQVLYHWRRAEGSTALSSNAKPETSFAGRRALDESLQRRGIGAIAEPGPYPNTYRVRRRIQGEPLVSILIPFRDKPELLRTCIGSVLKLTRYAHYEIIGIDNGSVDEATVRAKRELEAMDARVRFIDYNAPFNYSAINNYAALAARGDFLVMLNNDTEVISAEWLGAMLEQAQRKDVAVVGALLLYPDRRIQHAGVIIGLGGVAGHSHLMLADGHPGYFSRPRLIQNVSAVTFACAMTRRDVFDELGGLNATDLTVAFNDIDFCLRAREAGYLIVYTPHATLYHRESKTRGADVGLERRARFDAEVRYMRTRHSTIFKQGDPYYNPHLSLTENFQPDFRYADALPL